jgi:hypothetical protein
MRLRSQRGQTAAEYLGGLLVVSVLIAAVGGTSIGGSIGHGMKRAVCRIAQEQGCAAAAPRAHASARAAAHGPVAHAAGPNGPGDGPPAAAVQRARRDLRAAQRSARRAFTRMLHHLNGRTIRRYDRALDRLSDAAGHARGVGLKKEASRAEQQLAAGRIALWVARGVEAVVSGKLDDFIRKTVKKVVKAVARFADAAAQARYIAWLEDFGRRVAQQRYKENPDLSAEQLGDIAVNAASALNNKTALDELLKKAVKETDVVHTVRVPKGHNPETMAREWQQALSAGSRRKAAQGSYPQEGGGLRELPDLDGGWNGGTVGLRTEAGRTSTGGGPVLDVNVPGRGNIKIQFKP